MLYNVKPFYLLIRNHNFNGDEYADAKGAWTDYSI